MKKMVFILVTSALLFSEALMAQSKAWVPYLRFRLDDNVTDQYFLFTPAAFAGEHRFADGTSVLVYHFDLSLFSDFHQQHPLTLRFDLQNEYLVEMLDEPFTDRNSGFIVEQYSFDPENEPVRGGENYTWLEIPLQDVYDMDWSDLYLAFFDLRTQDGWGPSVYNIGFFYEEDPANIPDNSVECVIHKTNTITIDGDFSDWASETAWTTVNKGSAGIYTSGTVSTNTDLSASVAVGFDLENLYFAADVTDDQVVDNSDSLIFYFGVYDIGEIPPHFGHLALPDQNLTGYRTRREGDYRLAVNIKESSPAINESKIVKGTPDDSEVSVTKTAGGYHVEAKVPFISLYVPNVNSRIFTIDPTHYYPFAFQIKDADGSTYEGSLITGSADDVDDNPDSWAYKTTLIDQEAAGGEDVAQDIMRIITPGADDQYFLVDDYQGSGSSDHHRWADGHDTLAYHFNISQFENYAPGQEIFIDFRVGNEYVVSLSGSINGPITEYEVWSTKKVPVHDMSNEKYVALSLKDMRDMGWFEVYVYFTDGNPSDGWGPSVNQIRIYYEGIYESTSLLEFTPGNGANGDSDYLVGNQGSGADATHRWADGVSTFGYKFDLENLQSQIPEKSELIFNVWISNEWIISVADDENSTPTELDRWSDQDIPVHDGSNYAKQSFSLQTYIDAGWDNVVFFFTDGRTSDGWGPSLYNVSVDYREVLAYVELFSFVPSTDEPTELEYMIPGYEGSGNDNTHRWADGGSEIAYQFNKQDLMALSGGNDYIIVRTDLANEFLIEVAPHVDSTRTQLYIWNTNNIPERGEANRGLRDVNLKTYYDMGWADVIIFYRDGRPEDGWGPSLRNVSVNSIEKLTTDVNHPQTIAPSEFSLNQNYPNPFNPTTTIHYNLPKDGQVLISIYNLLGEKVKTLIDSRQAAGLHTIIWNGIDERGLSVASSIYFYRLKFEDKQIVKKMTLLK